MFEAADSNPRRSPDVPNTFCESWMPDLSSFVLLAACQDFQYAEESNFGREESIYIRGKDKGEDKGEDEDKDIDEFENEDEGEDEEEFEDYSLHFTPRGKMVTPVTGPSPRQGRFTLALIKILESEMARKATYESVIKSIGRLGRLQVPLAVGSRKHARLWFEE